MAWAEKMPSGKTFRGCYRDSAGRKRTVKDDHGRTIHYTRKSDAKSVATEKEVEARRQAAVPETAIAARMTWGQWWDILAAKRQGGEADSPLVDANIVKKHIRPRWGDVPLPKITHQALQDWVDEELSPGKKPSYARRIWAVMSLSMNTAVKRKVLGASPCVGISLPKIRRVAKPYMDDKHIDSLGDELSPLYRDMAEFGRETGLRPGELCGLHANRLDLDGGWLSVAEVYVIRQRVIRPFPKDKDTRTVPLTTRAIEIVRKHLAGRDLAGGCGMVHTDGRACDSALVFLTETGRVPVNPRYYGNALRDAARKAGVPVRSPYSARRGFATWASHGLDAFELAEMMGHEDVAQTRGYVQMTPAARDRLLAARGENRPLRAVPGAAGADAGADSSRTGLDGAGTEGAEDAV